MRLGRARGPRRQRRSGQAKRSGSRRVQTGLATGQRAEYTQPVERLAQRRQRAGDGLQRGVGLVHAEARHAAQQPHGVGVARVGEDVARRALFDQASGVEHADALAQARDEAQVVRDQQDGGVMRPRSSSIRSRISASTVASSPVVGSSSTSRCGFDGQRHGDDHALLLAARELERVAAHGGVGVGQRHLAQALAGLHAGLFLGQALVVAEDLGDLVADAHGGAQRRGRVLVDHGHGLAAPLAQRLVVRACSRRGRRPAPCRRRPCRWPPGSAAPPWPAWSCRSPTRRPGRRPRRGSMRRRDAPSTGRSRPRRWKVTSRSRTSSAAASASGAACDRAPRPLISRTPSSGRRR